MGSTDRVEAFIARWQGQSGGQERANYALFLTELCAALELPQPDPASERTQNNAYVFERAVTFGETADKNRGRIDLYKRGCFVLEAKQSRQRGGAKEVEMAEAAVDLFGDEVKRGRRATGAAAANWDTLMLNARRQAEDYAKALPSEEGWPPFIITCDVGHAFEVFADFSGQGKNYTQFPDRKGFRVYLDDLRDEKVRARLKAIWTDPLTLDPARVSARATREIAARLAKVSQDLEKRGVVPEVAAMFLMRCLFTMFAEDVELLPRNSFRDLLARCVTNPDAFRHQVGQLWEAMNTGGHAIAIMSDVKQFNGGFFESTAALDLKAEEIGELLLAAKADWREVEPAIFGTLLEQALSPAERAKLGAHYTPRAYVERLVVATVIEPLRADWEAVLGAAEQLRADGKREQAAKVVSEFHDQLCKTRMLDPACGTGNFLYVTLELMKRLEGEVLEALADLGGEEAFSKDQNSVGPSQFVGLELNTRARAIAELVLWIGYLQWYFRTHTGMPGEPILRKFDNIRQCDALLDYGAKSLARNADGSVVTRWDGITFNVNQKGRKSPDLLAQVEEHEYKHASARVWPEADFIVGNPPFIGDKRMIVRLGPSYVSTLRKAWPDVPESANLVMYWWQRAAELVAAGKVRRFGLVTTSAITMAYNRAIVAAALRGKKPVSIRFSIPDHPWPEESDGASVRIAMTVVEAGSSDGFIQRVKNPKYGEPGFDELTDPEGGYINEMLRVGANLNLAKPLHSNEGLSFMGVIPVGMGFVLSPSELEVFGFNADALPSFIRRYQGGKLLGRHADYQYIVDFLGHTSDEARKLSGPLYQHIMQTVKPLRDAANRKNHRENWWIFGEARPGMRQALQGLTRFVGTTETSKHRWFTFIDAKILPDQKVRVVASDDSTLLGILSSRVHVVWATTIGGRVGKGNDPVYNTTTCFDPFPFPDAPITLRAEIGALAEELDQHRKRQQAAHPGLTMTQMYNVLEKLKAGQALNEDEQTICENGLVLITKELHERIDAKVAEAYGWSTTLSDEEIIERLVALNAERAREEKRGEVRWLRPAYQMARSGRGTVRDEQFEADLPMAEEKAKKPAFPNAEVAQNHAIIAALSAAGEAISADGLASQFKQGRKASPQIKKTLSALHRLGVLKSPDRGRTFTLPR